LSALIGEATDRARALVVAVTLHAWLNLLWEFAAPGTWLVFVLAVPFWGWMLWRWPATADQVAPAPSAAHDRA
ncbi:MAG: hypothetical protein U0T03_14065, partial [Xanthomonadales bacterium]|nr:hypothetical protein [Xanthomonadales bacterium]